MINEELRVTHVFIALFTLFTMVFFAVDGGFFTPVFSDSGFFDFGPHLMVLDKEVHNSGTLVFTSIFLFINQCLKNVNDRVMISVGTASDNAIRRKYGISAHALHGMLKICNIILQVMRYANLVIFMRSNVVFAIIIAVTDVIIWSLITLGSFYTKNIISHDRWRDFLPEVLLAQMLMIPLFPLVLLFNGASAKGDGYFSVGPPIVVFGIEVTQVSAYVALFVFIFFHTILATFVKENIDLWIYTIVQNRLAKETNLMLEDDVDEAVWFGIVIYGVRLVVDWIFSVFLVRLLFTQYFVIIVYISAEIFASSLSAYRRQKEFDAEAHGHVAYNDTIRPGSPTLMRLLALGQVIEVSVIVIVFFVSNTANNYFHMTNPLYFGIPLGNDTDVNMFIALAVFMQICNTLYECVFLPDSYHYTYNQDDENRYVDTSSMRDQSFDGEVVWTVLVTRLGHWVVFLFYLEMITSGSVKFAIILAGVDIPLRIFIISMYIHRKSRLLLNIEFIRAINDNRSAAIEVMRLRKKK